jgi:S1-C subfamily serine protease
MNSYATYKIFLFLSVVFSIFCTLNIERGYSLSTTTEKTDTSPKLLNSIFKNIQNSVVQITRPAPPALAIHNKTDQNATALGSGFIYDKEGRIITNSHVVGKDKFVDVMFMNGNRYTAKVIGQDVFNDIAVIQLSNFSELLQPLGFGNSSKLEVGEQVIAVGNPYALVGSMTSGIVSHLGRLVSSRGTPYAIPDMIQIDALINPGNSGGPLINLDSRVVGMNTAGVQSENGGFSGIGLAIPSNAIARIIPSIIEKGNYSHPWLGISGETLTSDMTNIFQNLSRSFQGVFIESLVKGSPADNAGIKGTVTDQYGEKHGGDIVTAVDGSKIIFLDDLVSFIENNKRPGDNMTITVHRDNHDLDLKLTLGKKPSQNTFNNTDNSPEYP